MRILSILMLLASPSIYSAQLLCNLGEYQLRVETDKASCQGSSHKTSLVELISRSGAEKVIEVDCVMQTSTQFVTNSNLQSYRDLFLEIEFNSVDSNDTLLVTNDQTIGYAKGISTLRIDNKEIDFNFMENCNYAPFIKDFLEIPDQAPQQQQ